MTLTFCQNYPLLLHVWIVSHRQEKLHVYCDIQWCSFWPLKWNNNSSFNVSDSTPISTFCFEWMIDWMNFYIPHVSRCLMAGYNSSTGWDWKWACKRRPWLPLLVHIWSHPSIQPTESISIRLQEKATRGLRTGHVAQNTTKISPGRPRTRTAQSGVERTNHEATAPPPDCIYMYIP